MQLTPLEKLSLDSRPCSADAMISRGVGVILFAMLSCLLILA